MWKNPWNISSLYDLQFFNCPTCVYKVNSKQQFVDHAFQSHVECINFLSKIEDGSLDGLDCPWNYFKEEEEDFDTSDPLKQQEQQTESFIQDNLNGEFIINLKDETIEPLELEKPSEHSEPVESSEPEAHEVQENSQEESKQYCQPCDLYFSHKSSLDRHHKSIHTLSSRQHCKVCDKYFFNKDSLKRHNQSYHKEKIDQVACGVFCDVCEDELFQDDEGQKLPEELIAEHKAKYHDLKCKICGKHGNWSNRKGLDTHILKYHTDRKCNLCLFQYHGTSQV